MRVFKIVLVTFFPSVISLCGKSIWHLKTNVVNFHFPQKEISPLPCRYMSCIGTLFERSCPLQKLCYRWTWHDDTEPHSLWVYIRSGTDWKPSFSHSGVKWWVHCILTHFPYMYMCRLNILTWMMVVWYPMTYIKLEFSVI